jgi:hypothetical protein
MQKGFLMVEKPPFVNREILNLVFKNHSLNVKRNSEVGEDFILTKNQLYKS